MKTSTKITSIIIIFFLIIATVIIGRTMIGNHFKKKFSKRPPPGIIVTKTQERVFENIVSTYGTAAPIQTQSFKIEKFQEIKESDPRSRYIWRINIIFSNGVVVNCRPKQDKKIMKDKPQIKPAWQVRDWGNCGMEETSF